MATVLFFAQAREVTGTPRTTIEAQTVRELLRQAGDSYGDQFFSLLEYCSIMVDGDQVRDLDHQIHERSEVAVLPPVSGG